MAEPVVEEIVPAEAEAAPAPDVAAAAEIPPAPEPLAEPPPVSAIERLAARAAQPPPPMPKRDPWLTAAWAASFAALAGLGAAAYLQRDVMMLQWPASRLVYEKLGLTTPASTTAEARENGARPAH